jgi:predicted dehydrogenase
LAEEKKLLLGCCSDRFLGLPKTLEVKSLIESGKLGEIYKVTYIERKQRSRSGIEYQPESKWFLDRSKAGGGILFDWGPYDFAILNDVLKPSAVEVLGAWKSKPVTEVDPTETVYNVESHAGAMLRYHLSDAKTLSVHYERANGTHGKPYTHMAIEGTLESISWYPYFGED